MKRPVTSKKTQCAIHDSRPGKVYLVGAGPGMPELLTLKAVACLKKADVVLHDRLIPVEVLKTYAPRAELVNVGKKASFHTLAQDEIEDRLVTLARQGKTVVRLKGGDPYIFGRGGEEAERLFDEGIAFEVVPGVSSAFAAPLFAGIPLTHREYTPEIAIVTGHENPAKAGDLPYKAGVERAASSWIHWPTLAKMGTIVFLMGMGNLRANMKKLIEHGKDPDTPAAVVRWGGLGKQRSLVATVATIADEAQKRGFKAPAVIVVGEVVRLAPKLNWLERKPLFGRKIVITREASDNVALAARLAEEGAQVLSWPSFTVVAARPDKTTTATLKRIDTFDWLIFTSPRAAEFFLKAYDRVHDDDRALHAVKIAAIGSATAAALRARRLRVDLMPKTATAAALAKLPAFARTRGLKIFLPQAGDARPELRDALKSRHRLTAPVLYRKSALKYATEDGAVLLDKRPDWILFYSPSAVEAFCATFSAEQLQVLFSRARIAVIGPTTAAAVKERGFGPALLAKRSETEALVRALAEADLKTRSDG